MFHAAEVCKTVFPIIIPWNRLERQGWEEGRKGGRVDGGRRELVLYSINGQWKTPKSTNRTVKIIGRHRGMH